MDPFTLSWTRDDRSNCGPAAVSEALDDVDIGYTGDPEVDSDISDVEYTVGTCPDTVDAALDHLLRQAQSSDAAYELLREAIDRLQEHGRSCRCSEQSWNDFRDQVEEKLNQLPGQLWLVDDIGRRRIKPDVTTPDFPLMFGCAFQTHPSDHIDGPPSEDVASVDITWNGGVLLVKAHIGTEHREVHYEPLSEDHTLVAAILESERSVPDDSTPAHLVTSFDSDIIAVAARLIVAGCAPTPGRQTYAHELLTRLVALKAHPDSQIWTTVSRLAPGWSSTLDELAETAGAVLQPAG